MSEAVNVHVADDYKTLLRIIRNLFKQIDSNNVEKAMDGGEASAKLKLGECGSVIGDWNRQRMTGLELLAEVRQDSKLKTRPVVMITAESKIKDVVAARQAGVCSYIVKSFNAEPLKGKIEKVLCHA
jgi:two-component system chemotaxis response regulator CheY